MEVSRGYTVRQHMTKIKKNYPTTSWYHGPLSARDEQQIAPADWTSSGLRAPHQADGPRARWHLLRPLMQLLLTSAAPSNIGQGRDTNIGQSGDTIVQTQFCVSPYARVKLIFSVPRIKLVIFAQGPCSLHAQFSSQLDLCV